MVSIYYVNSSTFTIAHNSDMMRLVISQLIGITCVKVNYISRLWNIPISNVVVKTSRIKPI